MAEKKEVEKTKEEDLRQKYLENLEKDRVGAEILALYNKISHDI